MLPSRRVSQMQAILVADYRKPAVDYNTLLEMLYVFEHKRLYILIHAPFTCIVVFDTSIIFPQLFCRVKFVMMPPVLYSRNICEILLYNWQLVVATCELISICCLSCWPLGEKSLWNRTIIFSWDYKMGCLYLIPSHQLNQQLSADFSLIKSSRISENCLQMKLR